MNNAWIFLVLAGLFEIGWPVGLNKDTPLVLRAAGARENSPAGGSPQPPSLIGRARLLQAYVESRTPRRKSPAISFRNQTPDLFTDGGTPSLPLGGERVDSISPTH